MIGNVTPKSEQNTRDIATGEPATSPVGDAAPLKSHDYARSLLRLEVATYISQMSAELSTMARNSEMPLLSYFLDMAAAEARATDEQVRDALKLGADPDTRTASAQA